MVPGLMLLSERAPQLSISELAKWPLYIHFQLRYTTLQTKH